MILLSAARAPLLPDQLRECLAAARVEVVRRPLRPLHRHAVAAALLRRYADDLPLSA
jgi:hypothetical protein